VKNSSLVIRDTGEKPFECSICMTESAKEDLFLVSECQHELCRTCVVPYIDNALKENKLPIRCPKCLADPAKKNKRIAEFSHSDLDAIIPPDVARKLHDQELNMWIAGNPLVQRCPKADCKGWFELASAVEHKDTDPHCTCPIDTCKHEWCARCNVAWHKGSTCEKYQEWARENATADQRTDAALNAAGVKRCPRCKEGVQKTDGCNKMTCRCGQFFCNICGALLDGGNPYGHFAGRGGHCPLF